MRIKIGNTLTQDVYVLEFRGQSPTAVAAETSGDAIVTLDQGGTTVTDQTLKEWTNGSGYEPNGAITIDANGVPTTFTVKWPDGSGGTFTTTSTDPVTGAITGYTITHTLSGKTVTQPTMTRDAATGAVTNKPVLTVA